MGTTELWGIPLSFMVYVALSVIAGISLRYTLVGRRLYSIGGDERSAALAGVNVRYWVIMAFIICGVLSAIAGILFTSRLQSVDAPLGFGYELNAIAFAVIGGVSLAGGKGSPYRVFLGALVITTLLNILTLWGFGSWYQNLAMGIVIIVVIAIDQWLHRRSSN
jgi:ribose/xylose/arabinose/galactoside ABC-type transport system permease subunit